MWRYWSAPLLVAFAAAWLLFAPRTVGSTNADRAAAMPTGPRILTLNKPSASRFDEVLKKRVKWDFKEMPLSELPALIYKDLGVHVLIDERSLSDQSIGIDTLIDCPLPEGTARAVLKYALRPHGLAIVAEEDCLTIVTKDDSETQFATRIYPVLDLVQAYDDKGSFHDYDQLTHAIASVVQPNTWRDYGGGEGVIEEFPASGAILITQSDDVHREVEDLLTILRQSRRDQGLIGPYKAQPRIPDPFGPMGGGVGAAGAGNGTAGGSGGGAGGISGGGGFF